MAEIMALLNSDPLCNTDSVLGLEMFQLVLYGYITYNTLFIGVSFGGLDFMLMSSFSWYIYYLAKSFGRVSVQAYLFCFSQQLFFCFIRIIQEQKQYSSSFTYCTENSMEDNSCQLLYYCSIKLNASKFSFFLMQFFFFFFFFCLFPPILDNKNKNQEITIMHRWQ